MMWVMLVMGCVATFVLVSNLVLMARTKPTLTSPEGWTSTVSHTPKLGMTITEMVKEAFDNAKAHGFHDEPRNMGEALALIHSEVSEALEAHRISDQLEFEKELADIVIRVCDLAGEVGVDLEDVILKKMASNRLRPHKHGKKY